MTAETEPKAPRPQRAVDQGVEADQWRKVHWITPILNSWQIVVVLLAILVVQNMSTLRDITMEEEIGVDPIRLILWIIGGAFVVLLIALVYAYFAWKATSYAVTDQAVWLRSGIFFRSQKHVRFERIQSVDLVHPLLGRIFGLGKLAVDAAGGAGSSIHIGFLKTQTLNDLRAEIMARAAGVLVAKRADANSADSAETSQGAAGPESPETPSPVDGTAPIPVRSRLQTSQGTPTVAEAPETPLYSVPAGRLIGSLLLSGGVVLSLIIVIALIVGGIVALIAWGPEILFSMAAGIVPVAAVLIAFMWSRFAGEFDFRAAVSPDGIRIRKGLLETRAETIPPRRVHAIQISQPLLWRHRGWYRVKISQASQSVSADGSSVQSSVLLPVGSKQEALLALWLVVPDLGVADPQEFFDELMHSSGPTPGFLGIPRSARIFDPLVYKRRAVALTETAMVVRDGRIQHTGSLVTYERVQSQIASQGPWERRLGLADVQAATVPGTVYVRIPHLSQEDASHVRELLTERSEIRRQAEPPEKWFLRAKQAEQVTVADR